MKVFSNSKISCYQQCPKKYKLQYIDKIPVPKSAQTVEALLGSCAHDSLRELYQKASDGLTLSLQDLLSYFSNQWKESIHSEIIIPKKGLTLDHFENSGRDMLSRYFEHYAPFNQSQTIALEKKIQFPLDEYAVTGFIDRISMNDGKIFEIHDYKTSSAFPTTADVENDNQLTLYQIGLSSLYPNVDQVVLIWHFLKFDTEITATKTIEDIETIKQKTLSEIRKIQSDPYYSPNESPLCNWCLYEEFCPEKTHSSTISNYSSADLDNGIQIVDEYANLLGQITQLNVKKAVLEEKLGEIEKRAIAFSKENNYSKLCSKNFSLQIKNEWDVQFPKSTEPGRKELEDWLKNKSMWEEVSILQLPKLSKLIKNEVLPQEIHHELMGFSQMIHSSKVKLVKNKIDLLADDLVENDENR